MKLLSILCMVALVAMMAGGASAFSYPIMNSSEDAVYFEYDCSKNSDCTDPAAEYCGENQVYSLKCIPTDTCDVVCRPMNPKRVDESWSTGTVSVSPAIKTINNPVKVTTKDTRNQKPLIYDVEIYYGGKIAGSLTILSIYKESVYEGGTFVTGGHTDRQGVYAFTPDKPGQYVVKTMGNYLRFTVADANGKVFNCSNGVCETALGEDANVCSADCNAGSSGNSGSTGGTGSTGSSGGTGTANVTPIAPPPLYCGDGVCNNGETQTSCSQDCGTPNTGGGTGGTNTGGGNTGGSNAGIGQAQNNTGGTAQQQGGGDSTIMIILIIAIIAIGALVAFFVLKGGSKPKAPKVDNPVAPSVVVAAPAAFVPAAVAPIPASKKPKEAPKQPGKCKKCGISLVEGSAFCVSCGERA